MAFIKRIGLFLIVNFLILTTVGFLFNFICTYFGIEFNQPYVYYLVLYSVFGFGSALVSLFLSKTIAKKRMRVQLIDPQTAQGEERELVNMVHRMAKQAGLRKMPEFGIYDAPEINAFATGPSKNNSLVAVSTGLLRKMNKDQIEGVLGHEVAHIANGDMVTMTLLTGLMNTMVLFVARILADLIASNMAGENRRPNPFVYMAINIGLQMALSILGSIAVSYFSRRREYRADNGGAKYAGRDKMISALRALQQNYEVNKASNSKDSPVAALQISGISRSKLAKLLSTHPPLEDRIRSLERHQRNF